MVRRQRSEATELKGLCSEATKEQSPLVTLKKKKLKFSYFTFSTFFFCEFLIYAHGRSHTY